MKIILSTYNFYPAYRGGTEVYTKAFAYFLHSLGHQVLVIASDDLNSDHAFKVILENAEMRVISYDYEEIDVIGINQKRQTADDIYKNEKQEWTDGYKIVLQLIGWTDVDNLILNGYNTVSGLSLIAAVSQVNALAKINILVHTPFICPKGDMIYSRTQKRCQVLINSKTCATCIVKERTKVPFFLSDLFITFQEHIPIGKLIPKTVFRLFALLNKKFKTFASLNEKVNNWIVFSNEMKDFLAKQSFITASKIIVLRHGIDRAIFFKMGDIRKTGTINFLYSGRFEKIKGIEVLCDAWLEIDDSPQTRKLYIAGNWNESEFGRDIINKLKNRSDIIIENSLPQEKLVQLYRTTHCVIIPSIGVETGPMVFHEAIACGCDIIASNVGGQLELTQVYPDQSFLFENIDKDSLKKVILNYSPVHKEGSVVPMSFQEHFEKLTQRII